MDVLSCKSASNCARCHQFNGAFCELEAALDAYEESLRPAAPAIPVTLAWQAPEEPRATA